MLKLRVLVVGHVVGDSAIQEMDEVVLNVERWLPSRFEELGKMDMVYHLEMIPFIESQVKLVIWYSAGKLNA